jgi:hypothetical protein
MTNRCSLRRLAALLVTALATGAASAHHSVSSWFDTSTTTEVEGVVTEFRWQNPHVVFTLQVPGDAGTSLWDIETLSISGISRWGITRDLFRVGDRLRVAGNPARRGERSIFVRNILLPGGREIVLGGNARWSEDTLRGSELLQAREGDASRPELGIFRTWSSGAVGGVLFPEAVRANFDFSVYPLTPTARAALAAFDIEEYDAMRVVHMSGPGVAAAATAQPTELGHSVGEWEGGTLVVTTTRSSWGHFDSVGIPLSADAVMVERFTPSADGARLDYTLTVTDAATFTAPVEVRKSWIWRPEVTRGAFECRAAD